MNSERAKDILQLCRPDHVEDLNDTLITEALEQLEQDSALCAWFEEQQMFDAEISTELCKIVPAPDLKDSIIKDMQAQVEASSDADAPESIESSTHISAPVISHGDSRLKTFWFRPLIGVAAVLLFVSILSTALLKRTELKLENANTAGVPNVIQFLGNQIADFKSSNFDKHSNQINELQSYLTRSGVPNPAQIPSQLESIPTIGCITFDYDGTKMSMICFKNGKVYHLITINKTDSNNDPLLSSPLMEAQFFEHEKQTFKVWSEGDQTYILSTEGSKEDIPEFI